ncbi:MAG: proteasome subunit beta, partial [archaeon]
IYQINKRVAVTMAGGQGDSQTVIRYLKAHSNLYEMEREKPLSPRAAITYLANILNSNRYYPFMSFFLLGGFDKKPALFSTDLVGGYSEVDTFASTGSGSELALGVLEEKYEEGISEEKAIELAIGSIKVSRKRDIYTGGDSIKVVVIDSSGTRELADNEVKRRLGEKEKVLQKK